MKTFKIALTAAFFVCSMHAFTDTLRSAAGAVKDYAGKAAGHLSTLTANLSDASDYLQRGAVRTVENLNTAAGYVNKVADTATTIAGGASKPMTTERALDLYGKHGHHLTPIVGENTKGLLDRTASAIGAFYGSKAENPENAQDPEKNEELNENSEKIAVDTATVK